MRCWPFSTYTFSSRSLNRSRREIPRILDKHFFYLLQILCPVHNGVHYYYIGTKLTRLLLSIIRIFTLVLVI